MGWLDHTASKAASRTYSELSDAHHHKIPHNWTVTRLCRRTVHLFELGHSFARNFVALRQIILFQCSIILQMRQLSLLSCDDLTFKQLTPCCTFNNIGSCDGHSFFFYFMLFVKRGDVGMLLLLHFRFLFFQGHRMTWDYLRSLLSMSKGVPKVFLFVFLKDKNKRFWPNVAQDWAKETLWGTRRTEEYGRKMGRPLPLYPMMRSLNTGWNDDDDCSGHVNFCDCRR